MFLYLNLFCNLTKVLQPRMYKGYLMKINGPIYKLNSLYLLPNALKPRIASSL